MSKRTLADCQKVSIKADELDWQAPFPGLDTIVLSSAGSGVSLVKDGTGPTLAVKSLAATGQGTVTADVDTNRVDINFPTIAWTNLGGGASLLHTYNALGYNNFYRTFLGQSPIIVEESGNFVQVRYNEPPFRLVPTKVESFTIDILTNKVVTGPFDANNDMGQWRLQPDTTRGRLYLGAQSGPGSSKYLELTIPGSGYNDYAFLFPTEANGGPPLLNFPQSEERIAYALDYPGLSEARPCILQVRNIDDLSGGDLRVAICVLNLSPLGFVGGEQLRLGPNDSYNVKIY